MSADHRSVAEYVRRAVAAAEALNSAQAVQLPLSERADLLERAADAMQAASIELSRAANAARCVALERGATELLKSLERL
jgi:acyl-CoA reductase-like NAD-dependent aldehyde dehydrogenase